MTQPVAIPSVATATVHHCPTKFRSIPFRLRVPRALNMRTTCRQRVRLPRLLVLIFICLIIFGCDYGSRKSSTPVPVGGQAKGQSEAGRDTYKAQSSRIKSSNIKTH